MSFGTILSVAIVCKAHGVVKHCRINYARTRMRYDKEQGRGKGSGFPALPQFHLSARSYICTEQQLGRGRCEIRQREKGTFIIQIEVGNEFSDDGYNERC